MTDPDRAEFESRFSKPPFEWNFKRRGDESAWPGSYLNLEQEYAWQGFKMALEWDRGRQNQPQIIHEAPEGWQLVPKEPTEAMLIALGGMGWMVLQKPESYKAMLAAAPQPVIRDFRDTEPPPHRPSRDIMFDTRSRDE